MSAASILWHRIDGPGHDACRLLELADGWKLEGTSVLQLAGLPARLDYEVVCDRAWNARTGTVRGWRGGVAVEHRAARAGSTWTLDGVEIDGVRGCTDLDFAFTPATNLIPIRRLALAVGKAAEAPAAWLDVVAGKLTVLHQHYERRGEHTWFYSAPTVPYAAPLETDASGFVRRYPGLWEAVS